MADAARTLSALQALLADNVAGDISAQDLRDFLVSAYQPQMAQPGGRITLTTALPVTVADVTGATTIYYTPFIHNCIGVYDGSSWKLYTFSELSLALGTLTSGANYDVFLYDNAGTLTLKLGPAWTGNTTRGTGAGTTELVLQDGVYVNAVAIASGPGVKAGRYLGTIRTTSTTATEDSYVGTSQSGGKRFVWNAYNRVRRRLGVIDTTDSWTYNTATWRQGNGAAGNKVEYVAGLSIDLVKASVQVPGGNNNVSGEKIAVGVGVDVTNANSATMFGDQSGGSGFGAASLLSAIYSGYPGIGYHSLNWVEISGTNTTTTFYGDDGSALIQAGLLAEVLS